MVDGEYRVERYGPERAADVVVIHRAVYGPGLTVEALRSKFDTGFSGHDVIGHVAYAPSGEPAAYYGVFPVKVRGGETTVVAAQSGDTMTHPDHQGRGLFTMLGRATYEAAAAEGIAFVFGFPNENSYPGFVRKLGWTHTRTMRARWWPVPTVPVAFLAKGDTGLGRRLHAAQVRLVRALRLAAPVEQIGSSVTDAGEAGVDRDDGYLAYKRTDLLGFTQSGVVAYLKLGPGPVLKLGDLRVVRPGASVLPALIRITAIAVVCGIPRVSYHVSPGSASDRALSKWALTKVGLPYGHISFAPRPAPDPADVNFTYLDYDTY